MKSHFFHQSVVVNNRLFKEIKEHTLQSESVFSLFNEKVDQIELLKNHLVITVQSS